MWYNPYNGILLSHKKERKIDNVTTNKNIENIGLTKRGRYTRFLYESIYMQCPYS
jgi:hypothetical protein